MLLAKAWRESRGRFALAALVVGGTTALFVIFHRTFRAHMPPSSYAAYVDVRVFVTVVRALFLLVVLPLGLGGLRRERELGTLGFTLALPAPRLAHLGARAAVAVAEVVAVAALPALLATALSPLVGEAYPLRADAVLLWSCAGTAVVSASLLASVVLGSVVSLAASLVALELPAVFRLPSPLAAVMTGQATVAAGIAVALTTALLFALAAGATARQGAP